MGKRAISNPPQQKATGNIEGGEANKTAKGFRELHHATIDKHALGKAKGAVCLLLETFGKRVGRGNYRPYIAIE
jgi:hypothetical protein